MGWKRLTHRTRILLDFLREGFLYILLCPLGRLIYGHRNVWLVAERGSDARDNGYHFYRYLRTQHPEIEVYYVIGAADADYEKIALLGGAVRFRSLRHYLLFFGAAKLISTHIMGMSPNRNFYNYMREKRGKTLVRGKTVFLQHGIIKDLMPGLFAEATGLKLFISGARPEYEFLRKEYHYQNGEVQYTGLARFDNLAAEEKPRHQMLIMPTWRKWLIHAADGGREKIRNSDYCKGWNAVLHSEKLAQLAEAYDVDIIFYPHSQMQVYLELFQSGSRRIIIADAAHYDVQQLLKESMLLITDYSSVFFDFAYMKKPMLFYQFDEEAYRTGHYEQGYFDYRRDGFGEVVTREEELTARIEEYLREGCMVKAEYQKRIDGFFTVRDNENCRRIYDAIMAL